MAVQITLLPKPQNEFNELHASLFLFSPVMNTFYVTGCDVYTYGVDCKKCGNCSGGVQCDHETGSCPKGCDAGLYGDKCDFGKVILNFKSTSVMRFRFDEKTVPSKDWWLQIVKIG